MTIDVLAVFRIDPMFHPVGVIRRTVTLLNDERDLSAMAFAGVGGIRVAQAVVFYVTGATVG